MNKFTVLSDSEIREIAETYADYSINFQARIALSPSIRFGLGGVLLLYLVQPLLERCAAKTKNSILNAAAVILALLMLADCIRTFAF